VTAPDADHEYADAPARGILDSTARQLLVLLLIIAAAVALYAPAIDDYFQTDDFIFLRAARYADFPTYVEESFDFTGYDKHDEVSEFLRDNDVAVPFLSYRPLYFVSLKVMNLAFDDDATGYHLVSITVHVVNVVLVWLIARRLLMGAITPLIASALFALHPAYVDSVAWISDIGTPAATLFALLALYLFMRSIQDDRTNLVIYAGSVLAALTAILFHQQAIPWAGVIIAYGFMNELRRGSGWPFQRAWDLAVPFLVMIVGGIALHSYITANTPVHEGSLGFGSHMVTHFKDLGAGIVYPVPTTNDAAQGVALAGLLVVLLGTPLLWLGSGQRRPLYSSLFCVLWFLASLLPLLSLDDFFEPGVFFRKLYVVAPSFCILLALAGQGLFRLLPSRGRPVWAAAACTAVFLALAASAYWASERQNEVSDNARLWERYVNELQEQYPTLPEGTTVYVVYPPEDTRVFGDVYIIASAQALYGRVDARVIDRWREGAVEPSVYDRIFHYPGGRPTATSD
jgi:Dolichyl-phosphate-mannose-protein mannosyltransferase